MTRIPRSLLPFAAFSAVGALLALLLAAPVRAQQTSAAEPRVSLSLRAADLRVAVRLLAAKAPAGVTIAVTDSVPSDTRVTVALSDQPFEAALRTLVRAATRPLALERKETQSGSNGNVTYTVTVRSAAPAPPAAAAAPPAPSPAVPAAITLNVRNVRLGDVLKATFSTPAQFRLAEPGLADTVTVTAAFEKRPLLDALDAITEGATPKLDWFREEGVYVLARRAPEAGESAKAQDAGPRVTIDASDADVRQVIEDLFRRGRITNYTIGADVRGSVTLHVKDKPLDEALGLLCRLANPPLRFTRLADGTYEVRVRSLGGGI